MAGRRHSQADVEIGKAAREKAKGILADLSGLGFDDDAPPMEWSAPADPDKAVISFGREVKALGDGRVGGYLVRYSGENDPDLTGEYFTPDTDFGPHMSAPVLYHHGLDATLKGRPLGQAEMKRDAVGVWVEAQLQLRDEYEQAIYDMAKAGKLGWSSGTASHLVEREITGKSARITRWPLGLDASLTPTPAEPRNGAIPMKAYIASLENAPAATPAPAPAATPAPEPGMKTDDRLQPQQEPQTMTEQTDPNAALLAAIEGLTKEVAAIKAAAPVEKTPGVAGMLADSKAPAQIAPALPMADDQLHELKRYLKDAVDPDSRRMWRDHQERIRKHPDEAAHDRAFKNWLRNPGNYEAFQAARNAQMKTALAEGTASLGGNLVPTLYNNQLVGTLKEDSILRRAGAYQFPVAGTNSLKVTTITRSASAALVAEGASVAGQEPTFGLVSFDAYAYKATAVASRESIADSRFDVGAILNENFAWQFTQSENNQFGIGTGSSQPQGIAVGATMSVSGGSTLALALANGDKLIDLQHALPYQYRPQAVWFMHDQVIKAIRQVKWATTSGAGSTTQYNAYVFPVAGDTIAPFGRLLGNPIYPLNTMASSGSTGAVAVFCDPRFFWISDFALGGTEIQQLNERYADNWQVGWNAWRRFDSNLMVSEAAVSMKLL